MPAPQSSPLRATAAADRRRPFFVVGCARSGTTLVRVILDGHSRLAVPPESYFVIDLAERRGVGVEDVLAEPGWASWGLEPAAVRAAVDAARPRTYPELIDVVFGCYAAVQGKARWGDKTPDYVSHLGRLLELFPQAQVVHVVRDGRDTAASLSAQAWGPRTAVLGAHRWRRKVAAGRRAGRRLRPDQYLEIRLEDLLAGPEAEVRRLCGFLGESYEPSMLEVTSRARAMFAPSDRVTAHLREPLGANLRQWRRGLRPRQQRAVEALCAREHRRLGYPTGRPSPGGLAYGWAVVALEAVRRGPALLRERRRPGRGPLRPPAVG